MAIYYIDLNGGNDANDGLSFANRKKTFDGLISENDDSSDQNIQGDEFRVMGMPIVNTGVNATWTKGGWANHDANGNTVGSFSINGVTAGTPLSVSTDNAHGFVTGDIVWVYNVRGIPATNGTWIVTVTGTNTFTLNNSSGTGTYVAASDNCMKVTHKGIKVNTGCKRIAFCSGTTQTNDNSHNNSNNLYGVASSNVTVSRPNNWYGGIQDVQIQWGNSFTTGKAWYYTLPETLDLSAFQRISFSLRATNSSGDAQISHVSIKLCTDTIGDVVAHTMSIPGFKDNNGNFPIVHDFGTNLNSAIKSVALYVDSDVAKEKVRLRNIIAVKDANDGVSHCDVIGKNTTAEPVWWQCQYIQEDHMIFGSTNSTSGTFNSLDSDAVATYTGIGQTVALHKLTPYNFYENGQDYNSTNYNKLLIKIRYSSKTSTDQTKILGGWDQTNMTTQDSVTWVNIGSDDDNFISFANANVGRLLIDRFGKCQGYGLIDLRGYYNTLKNMYSAGISQAAPIRIASEETRRGFIIDGVYQTMGNNSNHGMDISDSSGFVENEAKYVLKNVHIYGTGNSKWNEFPTQNVIFENFYYYSVQYPFQSNNTAQLRIDVKNLFASGWQYIIPNGSVRINNSTIDGVLNELFPFTVGDNGGDSRGQMSFRNYNGVANDHRIYLSHGTIKSETSVRHGTDGIAWKIQPLNEHTSFNALQNVDENPLAFTVAKIFVEANKLVTFTAYLRRTNTGLTLRVAARIDKMGNYLSIPSDAVANCTASADTWQEVTLTFTPTDSAEITIDCEAFGGNSYTGYIDDISVTQAS